MHQEQRVCVVTTIHPPFNARIYERGVAALIEGGLKVTLVSPWIKPETPRFEHDWVTLPAPTNRATRLLHGLKTFVAAWKQPAQAYHFHDIDFLPWAVILKIGKGVPVVYDCHENYPEEIAYHKAWIPNPLRRPLSAVTRIVENWAVKRLGVCIAVVPHQVERFSRLGVKTVLVRNFANWKPRPNLPHERALICTGTLSPPYGVNVLLDIGREMKLRELGVTLMVTDRFVSADLEQRFRETVSREELPIVIHQKVAPKDMDELVSKACIGLAAEQDTPEKRIALPAKLFEYMALGLPIIASDLPYTRGVVCSAGCGIVVRADDAKGYVDAATKLLGDPELFQRCRANGFNAIESTFTWTHEKEKLIELFRGLVGMASVEPEFT